MHLTRLTWYQVSYLTTRPLLRAVDYMHNDIFPPALPNWPSLLDADSQRVPAGRACTFSS